MTADGTKGNASPNFTPAQGPPTARLRKVEHEIRRIDIFVSSDPVKHELFTFFRRADLQRDGKSIFSRLSAVLRSNMCTISEKKAARASDLLHPENGRLYRLFMAALIPSIRAVLLNIKGLLPCGMATFLSQSQIEGSPESCGNGSREGKAFRLLDLDPQLLASGHLLLSFRKRPSLQLSQPQVANEGHQVKFLEQQGSPIGKSDPLVVLAPSGGVARHAPTQASQVPDAQDQEPSKRQVSGVKSSIELGSRKWEIWEAMVESWLVDQGIKLQSLGQETWLDLELPVQSVAQSPLVGGSPGGTDPGRLTMWHSIRWPASLCFNLPAAQPILAAPEAGETGMDDPLSFAEDWFLGAEARAKSLEEQRSSKPGMEELDNQPSESDNYLRNALFANSPAFHRHALGDVSSLTNNIYPTPPDGPVSQVTPGMSSMDGVAATPIDQNQQFPESSRKHDDDNMPDAMDEQDGDLTIGTGQYDEDLFGDIPVETFGPSGIADEPNWDFFDEPDMEIVTDELEQDIPADSEHSDSPKMGKFDTSGLSLNIPKDENSSPMLEDQQVIKQDQTQIGDPSPSSLQPALLDSSKSEERLPNKDQNVDSLEATALNERQPLLTESDVKNAVADSILLIQRSSKETAECNARSDRDRNSDQNHEIFADVAQTGRGAHFSDYKYSANGRFWFGNNNDNLKDSPNPNSGNELPRIGLPPFDSSSRIPVPTTDGPDDEVMLDTTQSESPSSADQSDFDSSDFLSSPNEPETPSADASREWTKYMPASPQYPEGEDDSPNEQEIKNGFDQVLECLRIDGAKPPWPVYERHSPESGTTLAIGTNTIMFAQILVDQVAQSSLQQRMLPMPETEDLPLLDGDMSRELSEAYGATEHLNLHQLARVSCTGNDEGEKISKLGDTHISIYREGKPLTALSTILPFWDALGLQPAGGQKNVTALCIHPCGSNVVDGCRVFIDRLRETYENCNLGSHTIGRIAGTTNDGLVAWSATDNSLPDLLQTCERVGTALSRLPATDDSIIIYMIVPNEFEAQLLIICQGFTALWSTYVKTCGKKQPNEVALQLIPMTFVALPDTLAIPAQSEYVALAIEAYNRCPPPDVAEKIAYCGSAIVLGERTSNQVHFDLSSTAQSPFEKNGRCLHLAYSHSKDNRWITAAWTDPLGHTALTMSYCLRQKGSRVARLVSGVIKELWEISLDLMQKSSTKWRLIVGKEGRLNPTEINDWAVLANEEIADGKESQHILVLLSIDSEPSLSLRLSPSIIRHVQSGGMQHPSGLYGTPVSTPQASTTSPDQTTIATPTPGGTALNAPTPPEHAFDPNAETDLSVSDPIEGTWSVILSHGINQATSILEARPALASGYLLKRKGTTDVDNVVALEVNIIHTAVTSPSERQDLLKEVLSQYKDLVTLAKTRGMIDPVGCVLPWHIATAIKGQQVLSLLM